MSGETVEITKQGIKFYDARVSFQILFTATGAARGVSGHTGGPFDTVPEVCILEALFEGEKTKDKFVPIMFDEAGHRVATQYFLAAAHGHIPPEHLLYYRAANSKLPGHPSVEILGLDLN